jgi:pyridoxamine 5'-phosphate oxidase
MNKKEIIEFITANPIGYLATIEGNAARVRGMDTLQADDDGLVLYTGKNKDVFKQLAANPNVEVCYFAKGKQVRVRGKIEMIEDTGVKKEVVNKRPFLKPYITNGYEMLAVCLLKGQASYWSMDNMAASPVYIDF